MNLFQWQEVYPGDLKFRIASALAAEDKKEEALKFCEKWYAEDQHEWVGANSPVASSRDLR
mgnify:FL=1